MAIAAKWWLKSNSNDSSGNGYNGTDSGGFSYAAVGPYSGAAVYAGTNDKTDIATLVTSTNSFGFIGWVRYDDLTTSTTEQRWFSERQTAGQAAGWYMRINNTTNKYLKLEFYTTGGTVREPIDTVALVASTWYQVAAYVDNGNTVSKLYKNGKEVASVSFTGNILAGTAPMSIGRQATDFAKAAVSALAVYDSSTNFASNFPAYVKDNYALTKGFF